MKSEKYKLLILGNKRHGKTFVANELCKITNLKFKDSSMAAAEIFIFDKLKEKYGYKDLNECFEDRVNHRSEWYDLICDYNKEDKARLAKDILKENDIYVGIRDKKEIDECKKQGLFDYIIGVYDPDKEEESSDSFNIDLFREADLVIRTGGDIDRVKKIVKLIHWTL